MQRDVRIDVIRGAGILMIALDHLGVVVERLAPSGFTLPFVTWTRVGWSSAAEFFVFFSGYLIGLVYSKTLRSRGAWLLQARAVHRSWQIYVANLLTMCITLMLIYATAFGSPEIVEAAQLARLNGNGDAASWVGFLTLQTAPMFFEILHLYIVLLLVAPLFLLLARRSALAALAFSVALWGAVQINPSINFSGWNFNPFAWQLAFVLGMLCSTGNVFARIEAAFARKALLCVTGALLLGALALKVLDKADIALPLLGAIDVIGIGKTTLAPLRLLHFLVSVVFVLQILPRSERAKASLPARAVARIGQFSLECFCVSTIIVYAAAGLLFNTDSIGTFNVLLGGAVLVLLLCAFAVFMEWIRSNPWRDGGTTSKSIDAVEAPIAQLSEGPSRYAASNSMLRGR